MSELSDDSNGVNKQLDSNQIKEESMATANNGSQSWGQMPDKDMHLSQSVDTNHIKAEDNESIATNEFNVTLNEMIFSRMNAVQYCPSDGFVGLNKDEEREYEVEFILELFERWAPIPNGITLCDAVIGTNAKWNLKRKPKNRFLVHEVDVRTAINSVCGVDGIGVYLVLSAPELNKSHAGVLITETQSQRIKFFYWDPLPKGKGKGKANVKLPQVLRTVLYRHSLNKVEKGFVYRGYGNQKQNNGLELCLRFIANILNDSAFHTTIEWFPHICKLT